MSWTPSDKEIDAIISLEPAKRYQHCIKRIADMGEIWSLGQDDGWALAADDKGRELVPVWPHSRYAALCTEGAWSGFAPKSIQLGLWLDRWVPGIEKDRRLIAVFPIPKDKGILVDPRRFEQDLLAELSQYE